MSGKAEHQSYPPVSNPVIRGYSSTGHPLIFDQLNHKPAGIQKVKTGRCGILGEHAVQVNTLSTGLLLSL